ncbi:MAG: acetate--CoA ligase family protein, partial [Planctomycetota bacterium]
MQKEDRLQLDETESKDLLLCYGIPANRGRLARTGDEAVALAEEIGYP